MSSLTSSVFWSCDVSSAMTAAPAASTVINTINEYVTVWTTEYLQACSSSTFMETFTVTETCTGDQQAYTTPTMPPNFTTTVVVCTACQGEPTVTVTCPDPEYTPEPVAVVDDTPASPGPVDAAGGCESGGCGGDDGGSGTTTNPATPDEGGVVDGGVVNDTPDNGSPPPPVDGGDANSPVIVFDAPEEEYVQASSGFVARASFAMVGGLAIISAFFL